MYVHIIVCPYQAPKHDGKPVIGQKITDFVNFCRVALPTAVKHVEKHPGPQCDDDPNGHDARGEWLISLPPMAITTVSSGIGHRSREAENYVLRQHYGRITACLQRRFALPATDVVVTVVTIDRYRKVYLQELANGQGPTEEMLKGVTHVIMDFRVHAGPIRQHVPDPHQLVRELARQYRRLPSDEAVARTLEEILEQAWTANAYRDFDIVAD